MKQMIRNLWFNYRSEVFFGVVLFTLTVLSYWLGAFIPESVFENYVNPTEYICISVISLFGAALLFVHEDRNTIRRSWAIVLLAMGCFYCPTRCSMHPLPLVTCWLSCSSSIPRKFCVPGGSSGGAQCCCCCR